MPGFIPLHPTHFKSGTGASQPNLAQVDNTNFSFVTKNFDPATDEVMNAHFHVPFMSNNNTWPARIAFRNSVTTNDVFFQMGHDSDQNSTTVSTTNATAQTTVRGTTLNLNSTAFTPAVNTTANRMFFMNLVRDANHANDTATDDTQLIQAFTRATASLTNLGIQEDGLPMAGFALPSAGSVTLTETYADPNDVDALSFPNGGGYAEYIFTLPQYYTGNLKITTVIQPGDTGTTEWRHDLSYIGVGEAFDAAFSSGSAFTITGGSATTFYFDTQRAVVAGAAAGDTVHLRVRRTANGTSTAAALLVGIQVSYDVGVSLGRLPLNPQSLVVPAASGGTIVQKQDTNSCYYVGRFASGATSNLCGQVALTTTSYAGGGKLKIRWIASGSGSLQMKGLYAIMNMTTDVSTNPSATDPGTVTTAAGGSGVLNETTIALGNPSLAAASSFIAFVKFQRQSADTIPANVEIVDAWWEFIPI